MKFLVVLALAAVAAAEPEADSFYNPYLYSGYSPLATTYAAGYTSYPYATTAYSGVYSPYVYGHRFVKREADAEAKPYYAIPYAAGVHPYAHATYAHAAYSPVVYSHATPLVQYPYVYTPKNVAVQKAEGAPAGYKAINAGAEHHVNKREAESDAYLPYAYTYPSVYGSYGVPATTYAAGYTYPYAGVYSSAYARPYYY